MFDPALRVPFGYQRSYRTLAEIEVWLLAHHHPEYVRRLLSWLTFKAGTIGPGGGWRADGTQPDKPGFAPEGRSFHQNQQYSDGFIGACAVDLVCPNGSNVHRSPRWSEVPAQASAEAAGWGVHCNIGSEPWHMQPIEIDGWQSWRDAGSPGPVAGYPLPGDDPPDPEPMPPASEPPLTEEDDMARKNWIACKLANGSYWLGDGESCRWASPRMVEAHVAAGPVVDASTGKRIASRGDLTVVSEAVRDFLLGALDTSKPTTAPVGG